MLTGIIKEAGKIKEIRRKSGLWKIGIFLPSVSSDAALGDSISVNGVCLTVVEKKRDVCG